MTMVDRVMFVSGTVPSLKAEMAQRQFDATLEWIETGEPQMVGWKLYWDPIQGFTGDEINVMMLNELMEGKLD